MTAPELLARRFHNLYEHMAPQFGYTTREDTRLFIPESPNGKLMIAVCEALAASPEVSALIAEARREWCKKMDRIADEIDEQVKVTRAYVGDCGMDHNQKELMKICTSHFLDKAATIRALKETTHD